MAELLESMGIKWCQRLTENPGEVAEFSGSVAVPLLDRCHDGATCQPLKPGSDLEISNTAVTHSQNSASAAFPVHAEWVYSGDCGNPASSDWMSDWSTANVPNERNAAFEK